ncbi:ferredoxin [bacterium CG_4_10_14_0_2_um_filter_33_32]|nr:MAG: hypothetical protein AUJ93_04725 [bacterium CG2_30_33_46]PIR67509.1 MAG: ferredoxin [bacterium CG10_big_fil_rev_8_21_14_0_10_33_18]PIU76263.1 MAG: ferredoxin [bacterium CG06_land_8_20_14_3_00_33_50]PIW81535.1 MAG: ferredoxin [bacterium CG_4_8_14_3_um_filter_33_28]PIY85774.1 MAG: ferredoxin [bacterium CG_4_10_14_0_8_um_filter_33_57]PIZ85642.1 MAG: ferredoxin [bacterium CG_4_10_14_0_2_um_filter_33_32]PJA71987.1 MAG: ferredoxin [bacterium CG_4_9_14_3_um_filter_33_26]
MTIKKQKNNIPGWKELKIGGVSEGGSAKDFLTGDWRQERPVINSKKCKQCFTCWGYCPEAAFITKNNKIIGINYLHCKGCGICAKECPNKAIDMVKEIK